VIEHAQARSQPPIVEADEELLVLPRQGGEPGGSGALFDSLATQLLPAFQARTGIPSRLRVSPTSPRELPSTTSSLLYQLVESALSEVESDRSHVHYVQVSLDVSSHGLIVSISDDGRYRAKDRSTPERPNGLLRVRDLAFLLGGRLVIESHQGPGVTTKVIVPLQQNGARPGEWGRPARVLVADGHPAPEAGVSSLLPEDPRIEVVGQATNGDAEILQLAETLGADMVLLSLGAGPRTIAVTLRLKRSMPELNVVVQDDFDADTCIKLLSAGASACVPANLEPEALISSINAVLAGLKLFPRSLGPFAVVSGPRHLRQLLTVRELDVLHLAAKGLSNKEIAVRTGASYKTVRNHMSNIYGKLQIHDRSQVVLHAIRTGLVSS